MKKSVVMVAVGLAALVGGVSIAGATGEVATLSYNVKGKFTPKAFKPAKLSWGLNLSAPYPENVTIAPMKLARQTFPSSKIMKFAPAKNLPVCKASQRALQASPEVVLRSSKCANALIGNGTATFQLGQNNAPLGFRQGTVLIFNGGKAGNGHKIRFSAYSYDTSAAVYAEGILRPNGKMDIAMPQLTSDSSVTSLNLKIPAPRFATTWDVRNTAGAITGQVNVNLPKSVKQANSFVQVKCRPGQKLDFKASFDLGSRNQAGQPIPGYTATVSSSSSSQCGR